MNLFLCLEAKLQPSTARKNPDSEWKGFCDTKIKFLAAFSSFFAKEKDKNSIELTQDEF